jgi:hypothetical protein
MIENNRFPMFWRVALRRDRMGCGHNENSRRCAHSLNAAVEDLASSRKYGTTQDKRPPSSE